MRQMPGCFVTLRLVNGRPCWAGAHYARLAASARVLGGNLTIPLTNALQILDEQWLDAGSPALARGRWVLNWGSGVAALSATVDPFTDTSGQVALAWGAGFVHPLPKPMGVKLLQRTDLRHLHEAAAQLGCFDALLCHPATGLPLETTRANWLFINAKGQWATPPEAEGAYPGVGIQCVREGLKTNGIALKYQTTAWQTAQAAWVVNALRGVLPVDRVGGVPLPPPPAAALEIAQVLHRQITEAF